MTVVALKPASVDYLMEISEVALSSGGDILGVTDRQTAGASGWPAFVFR